jgi:hypothetical protein
MSGSEINRLYRAVAFMRLYCEPRRSGLWWLSTDRGTARSTIADIGKRITGLQGKHHLPTYSVTTFEACGGLHCHIVFIGCRKMVQRLERSKFGEIIKVAPAPNPEKYLSKERTPQAGYRRNHILGGRLNGCAQAPQGGVARKLSLTLIERQRPQIPQIKC